MGKAVYIAEKPSVAQDFAKALKLNTKRKDGYLESDEAIITWCVGHLVTMSYPESYDPSLKRWSLESLPFIPADFKYEVIPAVKKQFDTVKSLLTREDVDIIYVCTDSGREGEYIYRLVEQMSGVTGKERRRVWIDSQTDEEILRGIKEAKDLSEYDNLSSSAYLRAQEDYLMGINFSRLLTLKYGENISRILGNKHTVISVGRVMTCVLGMIVSREREIRDFVKTPFYRVMGKFSLGDEGAAHCFDGEWKAVPGSKYFETPLLYKENGFKKRETAETMIASLLGDATGATIGACGASGSNASEESGGPGASGSNAVDAHQKNIKARIVSIEKKKEKKNPPLLFNLAELQNECSKRFKISPDETLKFVQDLYEKKLVTYPRTDARVLSTAVAKEISKNLNGLSKYDVTKEYMQDLRESGTYKSLSKTRYVDDKQITDHYAIIPTGAGLEQLEKASETHRKIYELIVRRFLSIFYPPAVYQKVAITTEIGYENAGNAAGNDAGNAAGNDAGNAASEKFFANFKVLAEEGYLKVAGMPGKKTADAAEVNSDSKGEEDGDESTDKAFFQWVQSLKKGSVLSVDGFNIKEGETTPPKRYNSGSIILAMENAGQLIEDEELRAQIKGSGIGTSATRAEILKKLLTIGYLKLNKKTQIITPTLLGEMIYDVVQNSIVALLNPELTASWEKGLTLVANGEITPGEYTEKLNGFINRRTSAVLGLSNQYLLKDCYDKVAEHYVKKS